MTGLSAITHVTLVTWLPIRAGGQCVVGVSFSGCKYSIYKTPRPFESDYLRRIWKNMYREGDELTWQCVHVDGAVFSRDRGPDDDAEKDGGRGIFGCCCCGPVFFFLCHARSFQLIEEGARKSSTVPQENEWIFPSTRKKWRFVHRVYTFFCVSKCS
jgi:hypothetical protein